MCRTKYLKGSSEIIQRVLTADDWDIEPQPQRRLSPTLRVWGLVCMTSEVCSVCSSADVVRNVDQIYFEVKVWLRLGDIEEAHTAIQL